MAVGRGLTLGYSGPVVEDVTLSPTAEGEPMAPSLLRRDTRRALEEEARKKEEEEEKRKEEEEKRRNADEEEDSDGDDAVEE